MRVVGPAAWMGPWAKTRFNSPVFLLNRTWPDRKRFSSPSCHRLRLNEHIEANGVDVFNHACKLGLEGIVSKRKESRYRSGRSPDWIKSKTQTHVQ